MAARPRPRARLSALALGLSLLAAGCASGPVTPAFLEGLLNGAEDGQAIVTPRGPLALSRWPAEAPRAVLLALHGYGDYGPSTYAGAAADWAARGIEVYAYDQRGFGRNDSNRRWPGPEALIEDLEAAASDVKARHPDLPLFVAGHSMGGGVALAAAGEGRLPGVAGLVLLAPAVWGGETMNPLFRASAWTAAQIMPDQRFSARASPVAIYPSDNIEMLRAAALRQPLVAGVPGADPADGPGLDGGAGGPDRHAGGARSERPGGARALGPRRLRPAAGAEGVRLRLHRLAHAAARPRGGDGAPAGGGLDPRARPAPDRRGRAGRLRPRGAGRLPGASSPPARPGADPGPLPTFAPGRRLGRDRPGTVASSH